MKVDHIIRQVRHWNLALVSFKTPVIGQHGLAVFANAKSGVRGGRFKNVRRYEMTWADMVKVQAATGLKPHVRSE